MGKNRSSTCGLSEDRDVLRVTAEVGYVPLDPCDTVCLVKEAEVRRSIRLSSSQFRMAELSEYIQSVADRYKDNSAGCYTLAVIS